jgi:hypothetical protein
VEWRRQEVEDIEMQLAECHQIILLTKTAVRISSREICHRVFEVAKSKSRAKLCVVETLITPSHANHVLHTSITMSTTTELKRSKDSKRSKHEKKPKESIVEDADPSMPMSTDSTPTKSPKSHKLNVEEIDQSLTTTDTQDGAGQETSIANKQEKRKEEQGHNLAWKIRSLERLLKWVRIDKGVDTHSAVEIIGHVVTLTSALTRSSHALSQGKLPAPVLKAKEKELNDLKSDHERVERRNEKRTLAKQYAKQFGTVRQIEERKARATVAKLEKEIALNEEGKPTAEQEKQLADAKMDLIYVMVGCFFFCFFDYFFSINHFHSLFFISLILFNTHCSSILTR